MVLSEIKKQARTARFKMIDTKVKLTENLTEFNSKHDYVNLEKGNILRFIKNSMCTLNFNHLLKMIMKSINQFTDVFLENSSQHCTLRDINKLRLKFTSFSNCHILINTV